MIMDWNRVERSSYSIIEHESRCIETVFFHDFTLGLLSWWKMNSYYYYSYFCDQVTEWNFEEKFLNHRCDQVLLNYYDMALLYIAWKYSLDLVVVHTRLATRSYFFVEVGPTLFYQIVFADEITSSDVVHYRNLIFIKCVDCIRYCWFQLAIHIL